MWWLPEKERKLQEILQKSENTPSRVVEKKTEPEVFISYQWSKHAQAEAIYRRLTELGVSCWMDTRQMSGQGALMAEVKHAVRWSKVLLACVTAKYTLSASCQREVNVAGVLKKPVIPLLLERMSWPPEGPMSLAFAKLSYISALGANAEDKDPQAQLWERFTQFGVSYTLPDSELENETSEEDTRVALTENWLRVSQPLKSKDSTQSTLSGRRASTLSNRSSYNESSLQRQSTDQSKSCSIL